jgi:hypothetical protein
VGVVTGAVTRAALYCWRPLLSAALIARISPLPNRVRGIPLRPRPSQYHRGGCGCFMKLVFQQFWASDRYTNLCGKVIGEGAKGDTAKWILTPCLEGV